MVALQNQAHSYFCTKWDSLDRSGCAPKLVVEPNLPTYQQKKILDFSIADCGHIYASTARKSASLALKDTSRTGEVATAKMLANTNDKQAPKPEKGEYKSAKKKKKKSERARDLSVRFCYQQIPN